MDRSKAFIAHYLRCRKQNGLMVLFFVLVLGAIYLLSTNSVFIEKQALRTRRSFSIHSWQGKSDNPRYQDVLCVSLVVI